MIAFFAWFERQGCLLNQILDFLCGAIRDDSVLATNSSNTDDARCGTIKDDSVLVTNSSTMDDARCGVIRDDDCALLTGSKGRDASRIRGDQG